MKQTRLALWSLLTFLILPEAYSAQYRVVELPVAELGEASFPTAINNTGDIAVNLQLQYNPFIDTSLLDFDSATVISNLSNIDGVRGGDLEGNDYLWLYSYINANAGSVLFQQIASLNSFVDNGSSSEPVHGFDTFDNFTKEYNNSAAVTVRSINNSGSVAGVSQDGFYDLTYFTDDGQTTTYIVNDFFARAFAEIDGNTAELPPPETTAGGLSDAYDININNQVVGFGTTELVSDAFYNSFINCLGEKTCLRSLSMQLASDVGSLAQTRGIIWQLDEDGNLIDTYTLGMLITPSSTDTSIYASTAVAINDNGIAVGESPAYYLNTSSLTTAAAIYRNDEVTTINQDEEVFASSAADINDNNLMVGTSTRSVEGISRQKFFVHDVDANITSYPDGFFPGSSSTALSINNENMVVGYAEYEASVSTVRRTEGFIYDYRNDLFLGLNDLIECNSPYSIVQANAINDNNEIAATALINSPVKNIQGEIVYDELGATTELNHVVAVKLIPIEGGSVDNCNETSDVPERQGASLSWLLILGLFGLGARAFSRFR